MTLRHLEWLIEEPVPDSKVILYEILPYSPGAGGSDHPAPCARLPSLISNTPVTIRRAQRVRLTFRLIVDAARDQQALLDYNAIKRHIDKSPWRDRLRDLRHDRDQFATAIGDKSARAALPWALMDIGQATRAGRRWIHYLRDHPAVLRKTIDRALEPSILQDGGGRPDRLDRVRLVQGVSRAYQLLTGKPLG